ncbi:hypothetical protein FALCPG4_018420 [Fusarium falciforme]
MLPTILPLGILALICVGNANPIQTYPDARPSSTDIGPKSIAPTEASDGPALPIKGEVGDNLEKRIAPTLTYYPNEDSQTSAVVAFRPFIPDGDGNRLALPVEPRFGADVEKRAIPTSTYNLHDPYDPETSHASADVAFLPFTPAKDGKGLVRPVENQAEENIPQGED